MEKLNNVFKDFNIIESERLIIRKLEISDAEDIFEFTSLNETSFFLTWHPHISKDETKQFVYSVLDKYNKNEPSQWAIELKNEKKVIGIAGFINLYSEHSKGEIAYVLSPDYQNKGYMTEALNSIIHFGFDVIGLNRIEAKMEIDNFASEKTLQKIGMKLEGCFYDYLFRKGKFRTYKFYSIIKNDIC